MDQKKVLYVIPAKAGIQKKAKYFELLVLKIQGIHTFLLLDSCFRRNDIKGLAIIFDPYNNTDLITASSLFY
ncbi:hypothetical protein [Rickettsia endosymbiont of Polydrusus tereticollis]|uniref:hypothetical protein n=1 Tax=Rickettsia endosymbiont of Polydrusus tereticollis TaxID=3066251 RepID=UPI003132EFCB